MLPKESARQERPPKRRRTASRSYQRYRAKLTDVLHVPGATGVFMSCARGKERKAAHELQEVMEERALAKYGNARPTTMLDDMDALRNGAPPSAPAPAPAPTDIEAQIHGELASLRTPHSAHTRTLDTDTECLCFLQCAPPLDSGALVTSFLEEVARTGVARSRFIQRLAPVQVLCRAETDCIRSAASALLPRFFGADKKTYRIEPRIRSHTALSRDTLIPLVASCIPPDHRVDLANAELVILVEILKNLGKYNVQTLARPATETRI
ncbi:hypothetical protein MVES_003175 [Malassezia vespertilionis]|uniref:THUMP domain-containing protein n=1 Tax=Malassezia vespertilionis TaxID=2020962 RepID=A0A2N1J8A1_9BASI|nr:hypothetical protein MVES_003175 [Malassezia vespertilionis]